MGVSQKRKITNNGESRNGITEKIVV